MAIAEQDLTELLAHSGLSNAAAPAQAIVVTTRSIGALQSLTIQPSCEVPYQGDTMSHSQHCAESNVLQEGEPSARQAVPVRGTTAARARGRCCGGQATARGGHRAVRRNLLLHLDGGQPAGLLLREKPASDAMLLLPWPHCKSFESYRMKPIRASC